MENNVNQMLLKDRSEEEEIIGRASLDGKLLITHDCDVKKPTYASVRTLLPGMFSGFFPPTF
jgi:hypothetical protein